MVEWWNLKIVPNYCSMHYKSLAAISTGMLLVILTANQALAQPRNIDLKRALMLQKLDLSQNILKGLVLERFDIITTNAIRLRDVSLSRDWSLTNYPQYTEYTRKFQADTDRLINAGMSHNLATASDAYHAIVNDCVACHSTHGPGMMRRYLGTKKETAKR